MKYVMVSIYDTAAGVYMRPFFVQSEGQAKRMFSDIANDREHDVGAHPEDYSLFRIGQFDDNAGEVLPEHRDCLITALECVAAKRNQPDLFGDDKQ